MYPVMGAWTQTLGMKEYQITTVELQSFEIRSLNPSAQKSTVCSLTSAVIARVFTIK